MWFEYDGNRYQLLEGAGLPYLATGRFGLDLLLDYEPAAADSHEIYIPQSAAKQWKHYLKTNGVQPTTELPNLKLFLVPSLQPLNGSGGKIVNQKKLAEDICLMCPRYFAARQETVRKKLPALAARVTALGTL